MNARRLQRETICSMTLGFESGILVSRYFGVAQTFLSVSRAGAPTREIRLDEYIEPTPTGMWVPPTKASIHYKTKKHPASNSDGARILHSQTIDAQCRVPFGSAHYESAYVRPRSGGRGLGTPALFGRRLSFRRRFCRGEHGVEPPREPAALARRRILVDRSL